MTEFFVYPINAIVLGAASEWIHGEDSVITFPLRMFRQEGLPYFYYGLHWHVAGTHSDLVAFPLSPTPGLERCHSSLLSELRDLVYHFLRPELPNIHSRYASCH